MLLNHYNNILILFLLFLNKNHFSLFSVLFINFISVNVLIYFVNLIIHLSISFSVYCHCIYIIVDNNNNNYKKLQKIIYF